MPFDIFLQIARIAALPIIEFVPLRMTDKSAEVLLLERSADDRLWPSALHVPGTVVRATDNAGNFDSAFNRIIDDELHGLKVTTPTFVKNILNKSLRGVEVSQIFWVEVLEEPKLGEFYPIDSLPDSLMPSQKVFIELATKDFINNKH